MLDEINIKQLKTVDDLKEMQVVEAAVWQNPPIPIHQTYTALNHGGIILGAYEANKMIGFLYSFAGFNGKETYLCSHMLGILPNFRKLGLGEKMKRIQAQLAKELGYTSITWTFDPLESLNAYLNIQKLGAIGASYKENHYGMINDGLNKGLPTDRIQIVWDMQKDVTIKKNIPINNENILLDRTESNEPQMLWEITTFPLDKEKVFVAIPEEIRKLKRENIELAKKWRFDMRTVLQHLFQHGYIATNVIRNTNYKGTYYCFMKEDSHGNHNTRN